MGVIRSLLRAVREYRIARLSRRLEDVVREMSSHEHLRVRMQTGEYLYPTAYADLHFKRTRLTAKIRRLERPSTVGKGDV